MSNFVFYLCMGLFLLVSVLMILIVLIQKGRGGGLASAFGGAGGNTAFGAKTGDVLTWATSVIFGIFVLLAIALNLLANAREKARYAPPPQAQAQQLPSQPEPSPAEPAAPAAPVAPAAPAPTPEPAPAPAPAPADQAP